MNFSLIKINDRCQNGSIYLKGKSMRQLDKNLLRIIDITVMRTAYSFGNTHTDLWHPWLAFIKLSSHGLRLNDSSIIAVSLS